MDDAVKEIVNQYAVGRIDEDMAVSRIARINSCNKGYAKQILHNLLKSDVITSESENIISELSKDFSKDGNLNIWSKKFVPADGTPAMTKGGELVRASRVIISMYRSEGSEIGKGEDKVLLNCAARYISSSLPKFKHSDTMKTLLKSDIEEPYNEWVDEFEDDMENYLADNPDLFHEENLDDFLNYVNEEEDAYEPINTILVIVGDDTYGFNSEDGEVWTCDNVQYSEDSFAKDSILDDTMVDEKGMVMDCQNDCDFSCSSDGYDYTLTPVDYREDNEDELHHMWKIMNVVPTDGMKSTGGEPVVEGSECILDDIGEKATSILDEDGKVLTISAIKRSW